MNNHIEMCRDLELCAPCIRSSVSNALPQTRRNLGPMKVGGVGSGGGSDDGSSTIPIMLSFPFLLPLKNSLF